jgi:LmbE family N-acetylglucosaminyl deacetylase
VFRYLLPKQIPPYLSASFVCKNIRDIFRTTLIRMKKTLLTTFALALVLLKTQAQAPAKLSAADIQLSLNKLNTVGNALYFAAHPDDENTRFIAYLSNEKLLNTAYISLTRGDGGQNLIGTEIREQLGIIRTQELLQARRVDGGKQFFSRANDFGYSKNPQETFTIWDKEQVLADAVWTIRKFRPDLIITRFSPEPYNTHGHHTASAQIAVEASAAAADPKRFPEQLKWVQPWQTKRVIWNTSWWFFESETKFKKDDFISLEVGQYNALLGKSYGEIAAESRSMHKSQGFGSSGTRGNTTEYLQFLSGLPLSEKKDIFEGIDFTWKRVPESAKLSALLQKIAKEFNPQQPAASVEALLKARKMLQAMPENHFKAQKLSEIQRVIKACLGLYMEVTSKEYAVTPSENLQLSVEIINRSALPLQVNKLEYLFNGKDTTMQVLAENNKPLLLRTKQNLPAQTPYTQPYWLQKQGTPGMFTVENQELIGVPENAPAAQVRVSWQVNGELFTEELPVVFKKADPVKGEIYRPLEVTPPVFLNISEKVYVFGGANQASSKTVQIKVKAGVAKLEGTLKPEVPQGWNIQPAEQNFSLSQKGEEKILTFNLQSPAQSSEGKIVAVATVNGKQYSQGLVSINYDHIPTQTLFPEASAKIVKTDLQRKGENIGYIAGAGDEIPSALAQVGYKVTTIGAEQSITAANLSRFDAVVIGVRAYNTQERLKFAQAELMEYVKAGGTVLVQYNTDGRLVTKDIGPHPFQISDDRVTVEQAEVRILKPEHKALNYPNKITSKDFDGWVQERGLYFPDQWDKNYEALLSCHDPNETPKDGGLLVAQHGKGYFVYTGYSWFRQLPAGVSGAYRIFANLMSLGK